MLKQMKEKQTDKLPKRKLKVPDNAAWVLTSGIKSTTVHIRKYGEKTEWPFPVSVKADGETQIHVPATQVRTTLPDEPGLF